MPQIVPKNEEIILDTERFIVSRTDTKGVITYANDYFVEVCGYSEEELLGAPHNIVRHPDMPRIVFKLMWSRIQNRDNIVAIVKNLAKDGRHYWVVTDFETNSDPVTNEIVSHTAFRKAASKKAIKQIAPIYKKLLELEQRGGMEVSEKFLIDFLKEKNTNYDDFIDGILEARGSLGSIFGKIKELFS